MMQTKEKCVLAYCPFQVTELVDQFPQMGFDMRTGP